MKKITLFALCIVALASAASAQTTPATQADLLAAQKKYDDAVKLKYSSSSIASRDKTTFTSANFLAARTADIWKTANNYAASTAVTARSAASADANAAAAAAAAVTALAAAKTTMLASQLAYIDNDKLCKSALDELNIIKARITP